jgi:hypothetical protein
MPDRRLFVKWILVCVFHVKRSASSPTLFRAPAASIPAVLWYCRPHFRPCDTVGATLVWLCGRLDSSPLTGGDLGLVT